MSRDELESRKIELEIAQLNLSWWKRPGYIAALVPTVVALASVLAAFLTGVFDARQAEIDASVKLLTAEKLTLELRTSELRSQELDLKQDISEFESKKGILEAEIEAQEKRFRQAKFSVPLNAVLATDEIIEPSHPLFALLIDNLQHKDTNEEGVGLIEEAIARQHSDERGKLLKGNLLRVLYIGTLKDDYLHRLHVLSRSVVTLDSASEAHSDLTWYWHIFDFAWPIDARRKNASLLSDIITDTKVSRKIFPDIMQALAETLESSKLSEEFHRLDSCRAIASVARDIGLDAKFHNFDRTNALALLAVLSPFSAVFAFGKIITTESDNMELLYTLEDDWSYSEALDGEMVRLGAPKKAVPKLWSKWLALQRDNGRTALARKFHRRGRKRLLLMA